MPVRPHSILWVSKTATAGDHVQIQDAPATGSARTLWENYAPAADANSFPFRFRGDPVWLGLTVTALDSGVLYIYYD